MGLPGHPAVDTEAAPPVASLAEHGVMCGRGWGEARGDCLWLFLLNDLRARWTKLQESCLSDSENCNVGRQS